jgi:predicted RNA-binding Zn ribbon-like protein
MNSSNARQLESLDLVGGNAALDFVNSVDPREGPEDPVDYLPDYDGLARWAAHASVVSASLAEGLSRAAARSPAPAAAVWRRAIALREALYRMFRAIVAGEAPDTADLDLLEAERRLTEEQTRLEPAGRAAGAPAPVLRIALPESTDLEAPLWPLVRSAVELLTEGDPTRLRACPVEDGGCGWVVLDETRNRSRRWCDMRTCGNHAKATRLTERRRAARARVSGRASGSTGSR